LELWTDVQVWCPFSIQGQIWLLIDPMGALILPRTAATLCYSYTRIWDPTLRRGVRVNEIIIIIIYCIIYLTKLICDVPYIVGLIGTRSAS
jgi:hypothetical protein